MKQNIFSEDNLASLYTCENVKRKKQDKIVIKNDKTVVTE